MDALNARIVFEGVARADIREVSGRKSNGVIVQWLRAVIPGFKGTDSTAWCSAFVYEVATAAGADIDEGVSAAARSWRHAGIGVSLDNAEPGDIVTLKRPGGLSWQGHVGIYCRHTKRSIVLLGGNQSNRVCFKTYPRERLLEVRRLTEPSAVPTLLTAA